MNRRHLLSAASAFGIASTPAARAALTNLDDHADQPKFSPQLKRLVKIPMRDGVHLNGTLYLPRGVKTPRPAILAFGPYTADHYHAEGVSFSSYGYPYISVDMRGRGDSDGEFTPFETDADDGHDVVEWIAQQPFCNGKVGMNGLSFYGYTQWGAVRGAPKGLATIVPSAPCFVGFDFPLRYNIFFNFAATFLTRVYGGPSNLQAYNDGAFWQDEYLRFLEAGLPYSKMAEYFGLESKPFDEWVKHPHPDAYWDAANPTPKQFAELTMPVLSMCGAYDGDQPGTLEFHRQHLEHAGSKANHYLVIGPWGHIEVRRPKAEYWGIKVGPESVIDMMKLHREWYAYAMEGGKRPDFLKKKITYYVMVADQWRYADTIEGVTSRYETLYLQSSGNPTSVYNSGGMLPAKPAAKAAPGQFIYDPRDLSVPKLELEPRTAQSHLLDQTMVLSDVGGKLVYHSAPFEKDTEVSGFFKFNAWIAIDTPDTDFKVEIYDMGPDGSSMFLTEQHFRARYREGLRTEKLIDTTSPLRYDFENFFFVSRLLKKNHRIRLVFRANEGLAWQKNYNSGKPVVDETMADARTVTIKLYQDAKHPSTLSVPIGQSAA